MVAVAVAALVASSARATGRVPWLVMTVLAAALLPLAARTLLRNAIWADPVTLWREAADRSPRSALPRVVLGESLHEAQRHAEAISAYRDALRLQPDDDMSYFKLAVCLAELRRFDDAADALEGLRRVHPDSTRVSTGLGVVAMMAGKTEAARRHFHDAIGLDARDIMARQWLAVLEEDVARNFAEALRICEEIQRIVPGDLGNDDCIRRNRARIAAAGSR